MTFFYSWFRLQSIAIDGGCRHIHLTRRFSHALLQTIRCAYSLHGSRRAAQCVCVARTHSIFMPSTMCVWLSVGSVFVLSFSCFSPLFTSSLPHSNLHSDQHFLSNANSVEGTNHCAFAQRGVLPYGEKPSSHKKKHHEMRQTTTERSEQEDQKVHQRQKKEQKDKK